MLFPSAEPVEQVVLVDRADRPVGVAEKLSAHRDGLLHRALSVFLFDRGGRVLLQQRAFGKYHCGGLWANACCSHPRQGEAADVAAARRLREELGIDRVALRSIGTVIYRADVGGGLVEHEYVHGFAGLYRGALRPDPAEVAATRWVLPTDLDSAPAASLAPWFRIYQRNGFLQRAWEAVSP